MTIMLWYLRFTWNFDVERHMWKAHVEGTCGRYMWKAHVEGTCGRSKLNSLLVSHLSNMELKKRKGESNGENLPLHITFYIQ